MLRNLRGILVVDDPDRKLQAFWEKDKAGVTRYLGWEANPHLLLLSAECFAQLRPQALASIEHTLPTGHDFGRWTVDLVASTLRSELGQPRSEEHTSELQSLMRISYAVFCLKKKTQRNNYIQTAQPQQ